MTREDAKREMMFAKRNVVADSWIDQAYDVAIKALSEPEIIRCRDCKCWRELPNGCQGFCDMHSTYPTLTDFCSWAERREVSE